MTDVTLIRPPVCIAKSTVTLRDGLPSLSLSALSASLKTVGMQVKVIDSFIEGHDQVRTDDEDIVNIYGLSLDDIIELIPPESTVIGLSLMYTHESFYAMQLLEEIIKQRPKSKIILGGEHATFFCDEILKDHPQVYACVLGEGDVTIVELVKKILSHDEKLEDVDGIAFAREGKIVKTKSRQRIKDLSTLPLPDWDACNIEKYLDNHISLALMGKRVMPIMGSRGCPYKCTFCSIENFWGNLWRARPVNEVIDEIELYIKKYNIDAVDFYDPSLVISDKWIRQFAEELLRRQLKIHWEMPIGTRAEAFDRDLQVLLKKSGLSRLNYAPETGSPKVVSDINKRCSPAQILRSMKEAVRAGLYVRAHMMMGTPQQDLKDLYYDLVFVTKAALAGIHDVSVFPFVVFPGTRIYEEFKQSGKLNTEDYKKSIKVNSTSNPKGSFNWNENFSKRMIYFFSISMMIYFYSLQYLLRPWRLAWLVYNYFEKRSVSALDRYIYYMLNRKRNVLSKNYLGQIRDVSLHV